MSDYTPAPWEIWEVWWRHEDGSEKPRPAVVIAVRVAAEKYLVLPITSTLRDRADRVDIESADDGFELTGLEHTCFIYLANYRLIEHDDFIMRRGVLPPELESLIADELRRMDNP